MKNTKKIKYYSKQITFLPKIKMYTFIVFVQISNFVKDTYKYDVYNPLTFVFINVSYHHQRIAIKEGPFNATLHASIKMYIAYYFHCKYYSTISIWCVRESLRWNLSKYTKYRLQNVVFVWVYYTALICGTKDITWYHTFIIPQLSRIVCVFEQIIFVSNAQNIIIVHAQQI